MMNDTEDPNMTLYGAEELDDELGSGIRIFDSHDTPYEIRAGDGVESRLYKEDETWRAKFHTPETDERDGYDTLIELAGRIEEEYGFNPEIPVHDYRDGKTGRTFQAPFNGSLGFNDEDTDYADLSERSNTWKNVVLGGTAGTGAAIGGGAAAVFAPPAVPIGAGIGAVGGAAYHAIDCILAGEGYTTSTDLFSQGIDAAKQKMEERNEQKRRRAAGIDDSFLHSLNRKRQLDPRIDDTTDWDMDDEYRELTENDLEQQLQQAMDLSLHQFEQAPGVHVTGEFDSYDAAVRFLGTLQQEDADPEQPSIYRSRDAFETVFPHLDEDDQRSMIQNVQEEGSDSVEQYLEEEHHELMVDVTAEM